MWPATLVVINTAQAPLSSHFHIPTILIEQSRNQGEFTGASRFVFKYRLTFNLNRAWWKGNMKIIINIYFMLTVTWYDIFCYLYDINITNITILVGIVISQKYISHGRSI